MIMNRHTIQSTHTDWKALQYFGLYRLIIALFFFALVLANFLPEPLGEDSPGLFILLAYSYLPYAMLLSYALYQRLLPFQLNVIASVFIDVIVLGLMMYASGGLKSGFGLLIVIAVASGSILSTRKFAIFFAAVATITILLLEFYKQWSETGYTASYTPSAILGMGFFLTSYAANVLATRLRSTEDLAESRAVDLANLAQLNQQIIERMQSGIIAVDQNRTIRLINESAKRLLGLKDEVREQPLSAANPGLEDAFLQWQQDRERYSSLLKLSNTEVRVGIAEISQDNHANGDSTTLIFLDDASKMRQQAQGMKLESLGRLAASIAHEIRNPLGAISHAGQLLKESDALSKSDTRLSEIIQTQSQRMNDIIENVMSISQRQLPSIEAIELTPWLERFVQELVDHTDLKAEEILLQPHEDIDTVFMDHTQLHQVLWNLCQNALRYSQHSPKITLSVGKLVSNERPYLDVIDTGKGISEELEQQLFEPFFTTEAKGSGLGLYISRELCEMNQASLSLKRNSDKGCCFRVVFPHPDRQHHVIGA